MAFDFATLPQEIRRGTVLIADGFVGPGETDPVNIVGGEYQLVASGNMGFENAAVEFFFDLEVGWSLVFLINAAGLNAGPVGRIEEVLKMPGGKYRLMYDGNQGSLSAVARRVG